MAKNILLIDDQIEILELLTEIIEMYGHNVKCITSGKELEKMFSKNEFDLVISDYQMPDMNGLEIAKMIKDNYSNTKVYIISGYHSSMPEDKMKALGICGLLDKPFNIEELKMILEC